MHARRIATTLGALLLGLVLAAGAHAAPTVDVTYDLSESTLTLFASKGGGGPRTPSATSPTIFPTSPAATTGPSSAR